MSTHGDRIRPASIPHGSSLYLPPRCKYRKQPFLSATSAASLAARRVYSAISRMLTREEPYFRSQWKRAICLSTASDASSDGTFSGVNSFEISRISLNATVMPPPVSGCRMFRASPISRSPGTSEPMEEGVRHAPEPAPGHGLAETLLAARW